MPKAMPPVCLSFNCIECTGGSSGPADLKTFTALGCYGVLLATGILNLGYKGTTSAAALPSIYMRMQLDGIPDWLHIAAVKVGLVPSADVMHMLARWLKDRPQIPLVLDPVLVNGLGLSLVDPEVVQTVEDVLLPRATIVTPNRHEASMLTGEDECVSVPDMIRMAAKIFDTFRCPTLVTGGVLNGQQADVFHGVDGSSIFPTFAVGSTHVYGQGSCLSAALTACLARGESLREAINLAHAYVERLGATSPSNPKLSSGHGPLCHCNTLQQRENLDGWITATQTDSGKGHH